MSLINVQSDLFPGSQTFWIICKSLIMEESLKKVISDDDTFYAEKIEDQIQVKYFSSIYNKTVYLFYFKNGIHINGRELYAALCSTIMKEFAEYLI